MLKETTIPKFVLLISKDKKVMCNNNLSLVTSRAPSFWTRVLMIMYHYLILADISVETLDFQTFVNGFLKNLASKLKFC